MNIVELVFLWYDWSSFEYMSKRGLAGYCGCLIPSFLRNHTAQTSKMAAQLCPPPSNKGLFPFFSIFFSMNCHLCFDLSCSDKSVKHHTTTGSWCRLIPSFLKNNHTVSKEIYKVAHLPTGEKYSPSSTSSPAQADSCAFYFDDSDISVSFLFAFPWWIKMLNIFQVFLHYLRYFSV